MPNNFFGKRITVMGLDPAGRGLADAEYLLKKGALVTGTDLRTEKDLPEAVALASRYKIFNLVLGEHRLKDFENRDFIIRPAKIPSDSPFLEYARKNKIPILSDETLFLKYAPSVRTIGVTGTRGKTTVTQMIYEIILASLKRVAGLNQSAGLVGQKTLLGKVFLGGNVQGKSLLHLLDEVRDGDIIVMELDSWKLQSFAEDKISPNLAIFTSFFRDHMDYYQGDMERYFRDKSAIFGNQKIDDTLIVAPQVASILDKKNFGIKYIVPEVLPKNWELKILGDHNRQNAALALCVARVLEVEDEIVKVALENFSGVPGRLEYLGDKNGIKYFNDTAATSPEGAMAAFRALKDYVGKIVLIGGGSDKNFEYAEYGRVVPEFVKSLILFSGSASDKILYEIKQQGEKVKITDSIGSMKDAFEVARNQAVSGDVILLSPAAASFGIFKNKYDRGDQFVKLFEKLK